MQGYEEFKKNMEMKLPDYKASERVAYMLQHPIHLKQCGGNYRMLADYIQEKI